MPKWGKSFLGQDMPTVPRFLDHLCYVVDKIGVESVGIGLDVGFEQQSLMRFLIPNLTLNTGTTNGRLSAGDKSN